MGRIKQITDFISLKKSILVYDNLKKNLTDDIFNEDETLSGEIIKMNKRLILKHHPYAISKYSDGRWKTYVDVPVGTINGTLKTKRKQIARQTKEELEEAIISEYAKSTNHGKLLSQAFHEWIMWRKSCAIDSKTILENMNDWKRFLSNDKLSSMAVKDIESKDIEDFFFRITANHAISNNRFVCVKGILNGIFIHEIRENTIDTNPLLKIDYREFRGRFRPTSNLRKVYTEEERRKILDYLKDREEPYYLAISLAFHLCLRIGELSAIKLSDIRNGELIIQRSQRKFRKLNDDMTFGPVEYSYEERTKGNQTQGIRAIPLSQGAMDIIKKAARHMDEGQEFLLTRNGKPILADSFNERLRKVCDDLDIEYRPSHQIRFTMATRLSEAGVPINQLSVLLGHAETRTTFHYIRQQSVDDNTAKLVTSVFD